VGVDIDEAGREDETVGFDHPLGVFVNAANFFDPFATDADVRLECGHAGAVHDAGSANHEVEGHGLAPGCMWDGHRLEARDEIGVVPGDRIGNEGQRPMRPRAGFVPRVWQGSIMPGGIREQQGGICLKVCMSSAMATQLGDRVGAVAPGCEVVVIDADGSLSAPREELDVFLFTLDLALSPEAGRTATGLLAEAPLRWVQSPGAGVDHPIFQELVKRGVTLTNAAQRGDAPGS
jgi:hypothetical protein